MFRRILAIALLGVLGTAVAGLAPAAAEPCRHPCEVVANDGVIAGLAGEPAEPAAVRRGLLARSTTETPAPEMAIVAGLAVLGATLVVITRRRRVVRVAATAAVVRYPVDAELRSEPSLYLR